MKSCDSHRAIGSAVARDQGEACVPVGVTVTLAKSAPLVDALLPEVAQTPTRTLLANATLALPQGAQLTPSPETKPAIVLPLRVSISHDPLLPARASRRARYG